MRCSVLPAISTGSKLRPVMEGDRSMLESAFTSSAFLTWSIPTGLFWILVSYWRWSRSPFVRSINALPGPKTLPFLGNFVDLNVDHGGKMMTNKMTYKCIMISL